MLVIQVQHNQFQPRKSFVKQPNFSEMVNCSSRVELESTASRLHVECYNRWATGMGHFVNLWFGSLALAIYIGLITVIVFPCWRLDSLHYSDVIMGAIAYQVTSLTIVYSTVYSDADQRKHQSFASLAFVRGFHRGPGSNAENISIWWRHHGIPLLLVEAEWLKWLVNSTIIISDNGSSPDRSQAIVWAIAGWTFLLVLVLIVIIQPVHEFVHATITELTHWSRVTHIYASKKNNCH